MKGFIVLILMVLQSISSALPSEIYEDDLEEKSIVQSIIQHENEVTSREDQKHLPRTPQYPIQILKQFDLNSMPSGNQQKPGGSSSSITLKINDKRYTKPKSRLFHVWLPVEILGKFFFTPYVQFSQFFHAFIMKLNDVYSLYYKLYTTGTFSFTFTSQDPDLGVTFQKW